MEPYSILNPAADASVTIYGVFKILLIVAIIIWFIFLALLLYATFFNPHHHDWIKSRRYIIGGGVIGPIILITLLVFYSLRPLPSLLKVPPKSRQIIVSGLQWWWRITYLHGQQKIETANEIWLPVDRPVEFILESEDVIHSFWVPALAGKIDMIPGRSNSLVFTPMKIGEYPGVCSEFCGASHSLMRFKVKVVSQSDFDQWLKKESRPIDSSLRPLNHVGGKLFVSHGCISCHTVRGVGTMGTVGPDLTHVGSRSEIASGALKNNLAALHRWIINPEKVKPESKMPSFNMIPKKDLEALTLWLKELK